MYEITPNTAGHLLLHVCVNSMNPFNVCMAHRSQEHKTVNMYPEFHPFLVQVTPQGDKRTDLRLDIQQSAYSSSVSLSKIVITLLFTSKPGNVVLNDTQKCFVLAMLGCSLYLQCGYSTILHLPMNDNTTPNISIGEYIMAIHILYE